MKMKVMALCLFSAAVGFMFLAPPQVWAEDPPPQRNIAKPPPQPQGNEQVATPAQEGGPDLASAYAELRQLAKQYKEARAEDAKQRIRVRAEDVMAQLFDAKVQREQKRIEAEERRLNTERELLKDKQLHKQDMVHQGITRFFETGEPPEWATQGDK